MNRRRSGKKSGVNHESGNTIGVCDGRQASSREKGDGNTSCPWVANRGVSAPRASSADESPETIGSKGVKIVDSPKEAGCKPVSNAPRTGELRDANLCWAGGVSFRGPSTSCGQARASWPLARQTPLTWPQGGSQWNLEETAGARQTARRRQESRPPPGRSADPALPPSPPASLSAASTRISP